jgi:hypothetical protein
VGGSGADDGCSGVEWGDVSFLSLSLDCTNARCGARGRGRGREERLGHGADRIHYLRRFMAPCLGDEEEELLMSRRREKSTSTSRSMSRGRGRGRSEEPMRKREVV